METGSTMFQFHTGSIKRALKRQGMNTLRNMFQFHTGSIKSVLNGDPCVQYERFNSILVRLKVH